MSCVKWRFTQKSDSLSPASLRAATTSRYGTSGMLGRRTDPCCMSYFSTCVRASTTWLTFAFEYIRKAQYDGAPNTSPRFFQMPPNSLIHVQADDGTIIATPLDVPNDR